MGSIEIMNEVGTTYLVNSNHHQHSIIITTVFFFQLILLQVMYLVK